MLEFLFPIEQRDRQEALDKLVRHSSPRRDFFLLTLLSVIMACVGLLTNNVVTIIASMLVAPVLYPLLSFGVGIVAREPKLAFRSLFVILASFVVAIIASALFGLLVAQPAQIGDEILQRLAITPFEWTVAIVAGIAASISTSKPYLNEALPGVAIAASIVPPLSIVGLGLAWERQDLMAGAGSVLLINTLCIIAAGIVIFTAQGFWRQQRATNKALERDKQSAS